MKSLLKKFRPFIIPLVVTLTVLVLFHSIFMLGYVPSESMEPTLETGSLILGIRIAKELTVDDIIISNTTAPIWSRESQRSKVTK